MSSTTSEQDFTFAGPVEASVAAASPVLDATASQKVTGVMMAQNAARLANDPAMSFASGPVEVSLAAASEALRDGANEAVERITNQETSSPETQERDEQQQDSRPLEERLAVAQLAADAIKNNEALLFAVDEKGLADKNAGTEDKIVALDENAKGNTPENSGPKTEPGLV